MKKKPADKPRGGARENTRQKDGEIRSANGKILNKEALAKELGVTSNWIGRRMKHRDPIPHIKIPGAQRILFNLDAVMAWMERHTVQPAPTVRDPSAGK